MRAAAGGLELRSGSVSDSHSLLTDTGPASLSLWPPEDMKHKAEDQHINRKKSHHLSEKNEIFLINVYLVYVYI